MPEPATMPASTRKPFDVPPECRPRHVAIIMDGNGRWARRQGQPRIEGHRRGGDTVRLMVEECGNLGVEQLTLFCFSSENWKRPQEELDFLMQLLHQYLIDERDNLMENNLRLKVIGRRDRLPQQVLAEMDRTIDMSAANTGPVLCLAINYGARGELVDAFRGLLAEVQAGRLNPDAIDESTIASQLYTAGMPDPDLLIRTAGEMRISNFLLWQISYTEFWVTERCWPEFTVDDFHQAIRDYASRDRRYGGLSDIPSDR